MMDSWYFHHSFANALVPFPFYSFLPLIAVLALWTIAIKGYALWHAARNEQKWWFVFLLIINGLGIPELVYLIWFRADRKAQTNVAPAPAPAPTTSDTTSTPEA